MGVIQLRFSSCCQVIETMILEKIHTAKNQETADLLTYTTEIFNGNLHFWAVVEVLIRI